MVAAKVTALVITYNHRDYVKAALDSVLAQATAFPMEIVIADDGSTDGTREIAEQFSSQHPDRVQLSCMEENAGDTGIESFFRALKICSGEYIATLEGDDYWIDPLKIQQQVDVLDARPDCLLCFHNCRIEYEDGRRDAWEMRGPLDRQDVTTEDILRQAVIAQTSTIMFRRELGTLIAKWPRFLGDWFMTLVASREGRVVYIDNVMSVYRQHSGGMFASLSRAEQWAQVVHFYEAIEEILGEEQRPLIEELKSERSYIAATEYEKIKDFSNAGRFLARALRGPGTWLAPYATRYSLTPEAMHRKLRRRLLLYHVPLLPRLRSALQPFATGVAWHRLRLRLWLRSYPRRVARLGILDVSPNDAGSSGGDPDLRSVTLRWTSTLDAVEVRVGAPDGPLLSRTAGSGETTTGNWVSDGMLFFLQNVSGGLPLTLSHTIDVVRVAAKGS